MEELSMLVVKKEFLLRAIDNKNDGDFYADFIHFFLLYFVQEILH